MKNNNKINRRESIALLASGLFSLPDLNNFNYNTISKNRKSLKKMKHVTKNNGAVLKTIGIIGGIGPQATGMYRDPGHEGVDRVNAPRAMITLAVFLIALVFSRKLSLARRLRRGPYS